MKENEMDVFGISTLFPKPDVVTRGSRSLLSYKCSMQEFHNQPGPFAMEMEKWRKRKEKEMEKTIERNRIITSDDMWTNLVFKGHAAVRQGKTRDALGMESICQMMQLCLKLARKNNMLLEPFQLEAIRACVSSSARRILGHHLDKYKVEILQQLGLVDGSFFSGEMEDGEKKCDKMFRVYAKRFIAVVAPRRNGKSKAGKFFVAVNAVCEEGARIVLIAHNLNAVLLYKHELLVLLEQIQEITTDKNNESSSSSFLFFRVHSSTTEICLEFPSRQRSNAYIYFVSGGINVSMGQSLTPSTIIVSLYSSSSSSFQNSSIQVIGFCLFCLLFTALILSTCGSFSLTVRQKSGAESNSLTRRFVTPPKVDILLTLKL